MNRKFLKRLSKIWLALLLIFGHIDVIIHASFIEAVDSEYIVDDEVYDEFYFAVEEEGYEYFEDELEVEDEGDITEVFATPLKFVYPDFVVGDDDDLQFLPVQVLAGVTTEITDISIRIEASASSAVVFEYENFGLISDLVLPPGSVNVINLRPIKGLASREYLNTLIIEGSGGIILEIPLAVQVMEAVEDVALPVEDDTPDIDVEVVNLPVVTPSVDHFIYPTTISGWAYNSLPFQNISFLNETLFAATNVQVSIVPTGDTTVVAFEYFGHGLGVGPGGGVFNGTTSIMPNGNFSHVRLRPAHEVIAGTHTNMLILEGDHDFRIEIPLTVTITQHPGGVANPPIFEWPDLEEGYLPVNQLHALTGPNYINFTAPRPILNVTPDRIFFASGVNSPFEINRGLHTGLGGGSATTTIGITPTANTNLRVRPVAGLTEGVHEDVLIIEGDGGVRIEVPFRITILPWSGIFNYTVTPSIDFGTRLVQYPAFVFGTELSMVALTNLDPMVAITGLTPENLSFDNEVNGVSAFEFEALGFRLGLNPIGTATGTAPWRDHITPFTPQASGWLEHTGQIRVRPRVGLPAGVYTDTLRIRGDRGFETTVALRFEVEMPPADVTVTPTSWTFMDEYEGYQFNSANNFVRGWQEFLFENHTPTNQPATLAFELGEDSPFAIHRNLTDNTLLNPVGSATIRTFLSATIPTGLRIIPRNDLPVGTHTDYLIVSNAYGMNIRIPLSFTVRPMPLDHDPLVIARPGRVHHFPTRQVGELFHHHADNVGPTTVNSPWTEFRIFNHRGTTTAFNITGVTARFAQGEDSPFSFNRNLGNGTGTGLTGGTVTIGHSGVAGTAIGANVRVWPNEGLPIGVHRDVLILENATGFRKEIILYVEIAESDLTINVTDILWPTRHVGYANNTSVANINNSTHVMTGLAEVLITNNGIAPITVPLWGNNEYTMGYFDHGLTDPWVVVSRGTTANTVNSATTSTAVTTINPGATVGMRFQTMPNLTPGIYEDTFRLTDILGNPIGEVNFSFEVREWNLGSGIPDAIEFDSRQVGYIINQHASTSTTAHGTDAYIFNVTNMLADNNLEATPQILLPIFESQLLNPGSISPFVAHMAGTSTTATNGRQAIQLDGNRNFWVRPRQGLTPGLHEDYLIFTSARTPADSPLLRIPISIYIYEPDVVVRENGSVIDPADGITFSDRMPGYTLDEHNTNDFIRLSFENLGANPFTALTATILQPDLSGPSTAFSVMTGIMPGANESATNVTILPVDGMVNLRIWQRLDLPIGTHEAVLRLGNNYGFEVFVPLTFTVEDFDTEFFDVQFEARLEDFVYETQTAEFTLRNNSTTPAFIYSATLERGNDSSFVLIGVAETLGTIVGDDILRFDVATKADLPAGLHYDYIIIRGNFGFERRVRVEFQVLPVYHNLNFHLQGGTNINADFEENFLLTQPVRLNQPATRPMINPTRIGYYFTGWFETETGGDLFDFTHGFTRIFVAENGRLNEDSEYEVDIFARWNDSYHNISFHLHGGSGDFLDQTIRDGAYVEMPDDDPEAPIGYYFAGWFDESTGGELFDFDAPVIRLNPSDIVIHARWLPLYHDVVFELQGGSGDFPALEIRDGICLLEPSQPTPPTGYLFRGWYTAPDGGSPFDFNAPVRGNVIIYARWMPITSMMITFNPNGGTIPGYPANATRIGEIGETLGLHMPEIPTRATYYFAGWFTDEGVAFTADTVITGEMTLYARWNPLYHEVVFDLHGGTGTFPMQQVRDGQVATIPIATPNAPTGYYFVGWFNAPTGGAEFDFTTPITENTVIYARYAGIYREITFELEGGNIANNNASVIRLVRDGLTITTSQIPQNPQRQGYEFVGWYSNGIIEEDEIVTPLVNTADIPFTTETIVSYNMVVYARWQEATISPTEPTVPTTPSEPQETAPTNPQEPSNPNAPTPTPPTEQPGSSPQNPTNPASTSTPEPTVGTAQENNRNSGMALPQTGTAIANIGSIGMGISALATTVTIIRKARLTKKSTQM